jgi:hypothetical protein
MFTTATASSALSQASNASSVPAITGGGGGFFDQIGGFFGGLTQVTQQAGQTYSTIDQAFNGVPAQPQGSVNPVTISTGSNNKLSSNNLTGMLLAGGAVSIVLIGLIVVLKK